MGPDDLFANGRTGRDEYRERGSGRGGERGRGRGRGRGDRGGYGGFEGGHGTGGAGNEGRKETQSAPTPDDFPALPGAGETKEKAKKEEAKDKENSEVQGWEKPVGEWADEAPTGKW